MGNGSSSQSPSSYGVSSHGANGSVRRTSAMATVRIAAAESPVDCLTQDELQERFAQIVVSGQAKTTGVCVWRHRHCVLVFIVYTFGEQRPCSCRGPLERAKCCRPDPE